MIYNASFNTYRTGVTSGSKRSYSATPTLTSADGYFEPLSGDLRAVLGIDLTASAWSLLTEATDFVRGDKVVILSANYYIEQMEQVSYNGMILTRLILLKDT